MMDLNRSALGMALVTCCSVALLGVHWQGLSVAGAAYPSSQALVRFTGWQAWAPYVLVASLLAWCISRLGSASGKSSLGPNGQLNLFHDSNALVGTGLVLLLHGTTAAWPLLFAVIGRLIVTSCQALRLRISLAAAIVWMFAAAALLVNSASEGAGWSSWCSAAGMPEAGRCMSSAGLLDRFSGIAPAHFTTGIVFRYTLMRFVSWALDTLSGRVVQLTSPNAVLAAFPLAAQPSNCDSAEPRSPRIGAVGHGASSVEAVPLFGTPDSPHKLHAVGTAGLASASWAAYLSYLLFAPLYLTGPVMTAAEFYHQAAALAAGRDTARGLAGGEWWSAVARMLGFCVFALMVRHSLLAEGVVQHILTAQPWHAWAVGCTVLTALYAQNFVPWTFAQLCAAGMGIVTPDETPAGILSASTTPATFWRNFHTSWSRWLRQYIYVPLGRTPAALVLTMAASTLLHGTHRAWLVWGATQCCALMAERLLAPRQWLLPRLHPHLRAAVVQAATQTTLLVQLPLGPSLPQFLACFHAVNLPFLVLNAARLEVAHDRRTAHTGKAGASATPLAGQPAELTAAQKVAVE
ncbi:hypothetical protein ABPG77_005454 [Micractinium sp. CCAP 211/92]